MCLKNTKQRNYGVRLINKHTHKPIYDYSSECNSTYSWFNDFEGDIKLFTFNEGIAECNIHNPHLNNIYLRVERVPI